MRQLGNNNGQARKLVFFDLETSGLTANHEIIQIGAVLYNPISQKAESEFEVKIRPDEWIKGSDAKALELNHFNMRVWREEGVYSREAVNQLCEWAPEGSALVGWNVTFDWNFLSRRLNYIHRPNHFHYHRYDVMSMWAQYIGFVDWFGGTPSHSLSAACEWFMVENGKAHDALADARATLKVFEALRDAPYTSKYST